LSNGRGRLHNPRLQAGSRPLVPLSA